MQSPKCDNCRGRILRQETDVFSWRVELQRIPSIERSEGSSRSWSKKIHKILVKINQDFFCYEEKKA